MTKKNKSKNLNNMIKMATPLRTRQGKFLIIAGLLAVVGTFGFFLIFRSGGAEFRYLIKPVSEPEKGLLVKLTVINPQPKGKDYFVLYKGETKLSDVVCQNEKGHDLKVFQTEDLLQIALEKAGRFDLFYRVKIGQPGKHGYRGQIYNNLVTFDGEEALLLPPEVGEGDEAIRKTIGRISVRCETPASWTRIVPFARKDRTGGVITEVSSPDWAKIYNLVKSGYTCGEFEQVNLADQSGSLAIYVDQAARECLTEETRQGLVSLYHYYTKLFEYQIPFTVVLLRKDPVNGLYLIGGASAQNLATTFDPVNRRDWELMAHRLFHAFFDSKIKITKFHEAPQLWFYEGLVTYYENVAMGSLPEDLLHKLRVNETKSFLVLFRRYVYMRLKDPSLFAIALMSEKSIESSGIIEFLHYTQAPLIIKYAEDVSYLENDTRDRILKFILHNNPEELELKHIFRFAMGEKADELAKHYLFDTKIPPLWYLAMNRTEDPGEVVNELNEFEHTLWTWLRLEDPHYPLEKLSLEGLEKQADEAEHAGVRFADEGTEEQVKKLSLTVYRLLKIYKLNH